MHQPTITITRSCSGVNPWDIWVRFALPSLFLFQGGTHDQRVFTNSYTSGTCSQLGFGGTITLEECV